MNDLKNDTLNEKYINLILPLHRHYETWKSSGADVNYFLQTIVSRLLFCPLISSCAFILLVHTSTIGFLRKCNAGKVY